MAHNDEYIAFHEEAEATQAAVATVVLRDFKPATHVQQAVCWMQMARKGEWRERDSVICFRTRQQVQLWHLSHLLNPFFHFLSGLYLGMSFVDEASWCIGTEGGPCPENEDIPRLKHFVLPLSVTTTVEVLLLLVFVGRMWLRHLIFRESRSAYREYIRFLQAVCVPLAILDIGFCKFIAPQGIIPGAPLLHRLLRIPIFLTFNETLQRTFMQVCKTFPVIKDAILLLFINQVMFAFIGMIWFGFSEEGKNFPSLMGSMKHLYVLLTTNNMPGIMIDAATTSFPRSAYHVCFLFICLYLGMNILLATIYNKYKELLEDAIVKFYANRRKSADRAFQLLLEGEKHLRARLGSISKLQHTSSEGLSLHTMGMFLEQILGPSALAKDVFDLLDRDHNHFLDEREFRLIAEVLADPHCKAHRVGGLARLKPYAKVIRRLSSLADFLSLVAVGMALWQAKRFAAAKSLQAGVDWTCYGTGGSVARVVNTCLFGISLFYALELCLAVAIRGWERFLSYQPLQSTFDLVSVVILLLLELWVHVLGGRGAEAGACRLIILAHGMRCFRCLHKLPGVRKLALQTYYTLRPFFRVATLLFCLFYLIAQFGIAALGGAVSKSNPVLARSEYASSNFWALNFNDFPSALLLMWAQLINNNANVWMDAFSEAFGTWMWVAFIAFDVVANHFLLNILMALVIDCVMLPMPDDSDNTCAWPDREAQLRKLFAGSGNALLAELEDSDHALRKGLLEIFACTPQESTLSTG